MHFALLKTDTRQAKYYAWIFNRSEAIFVCAFSAAMLRAFIKRIMEKVEAQIS